MKALDNMRVPRWPSEANFVLFRVGPKHKELVAAMRARGVLLRDRSADPGLAGYVRITVGIGDQIEHRHRRAPRLVRQHPMDSSRRRHTRHPQRRST